MSKAARDHEDEERVEAAMLGLSPRYREIIALPRARQKLTRVLQESGAEKVLRYGSNTNLSRFLRVRVGVAGNQILTRF